MFLPCRLTMSHRKRKSNVPTITSTILPLRSATNAIQIFLLCSTLLVLHTPCSQAASSSSAGIRVVEIDRTTPDAARRKGPLNDVHTIDTQAIQDMILQYVDHTLNRRTFELLNGLSIDAKNRTAGSGEDELKMSRSMAEADTTDTFDGKIMRRVRRFAETHVLNMNIPRTFQATARSFFIKSLKKFMWPMFIGMQVVKTMLLAMFLPSIIGSLGKIVGKGLSSVSGFGLPPAETVENLEFKDNYANANIQAEGDYLYPQSVDALGNPNFAAQMYDSATANNALSRYGVDANRVTYVNSASDYRPVSVARPAMMANSATAFSKLHDFKDFHDIPASSMLLTNYDPFYSPLLSRLDAVFQQMSLPAGNEKCREKLVCLMYFSPAKYAPYSNLVSAQLSRELNELKKPTTDNPDILRFFKYMRAAKDGQDRTNCDAAFSECTSLKDSDSPAMLTTYNDINKLVQARKM